MMKPIFVCRFTVVALAGMLAHYNEKTSGSFLAFTGTW